MDNKNFLTSKEYNTIAVKFLTDVLYKYNKEEYDELLRKLFCITIKDVDTVAVGDIKQEKKLREELINKPITNKPTITNS
jgi:methionine salvage enolase-phosphatase E1